MLLSRLCYYFSSLPTLVSGIRNWSALWAVLRRQPVIVTLRDGAQFHVRTPMDVWVLKEAILDRQYERAGVAIQDGWTVLDIGAGIGDFAIDVARRNPRAVVYAFEPFPESFALLEKNMTLNRVGNVRAFPRAISDADGTLELQVISAEAVQHTVVSATVRARQTLRVPSQTLAHAFAELGIAQCDFLKMDCEGAEYAIFFNTPPATLRQIKHICLEHHDGVTPHSHADLVCFFEQHGFRVQHIPSPAHRNLGLLYAANTTPGS